jgi:type IX secretion system PorP/SprF family membrane protein
MKSLKNKLPVLLLLLACVPAAAQDIHFSQFYESSVLRNPALIGLMQEDYKVVVSHRNQWSSVAKPFKTSLISAEAHFPVGRDGVDYISVGLAGYSDKAGRISLQTTAFYPAINYNKSLEDAHGSYLSVGFTGGYLQRSIDLSKMTFDHMYQGGVVVPGAGSGENLPAPKVSHWDLGAGVSFNSSLGEDNQVSYILGVGAYHFTQPRQSFFGNGQVASLQTRWNVNADVNWRFNDEWNIMFHANLMRQGSQQELIAGGQLRWSQTNSFNQKPFAMSVGTFYRIGDAIVPVVKLEHKSLAFAMSYDVNISKLREVSRMRGGLELSAFLSGLFSGRIDDKRICPRF